MSSLIWNVWGLNDPIKQSSVLRVAQRYDVEILCLLETCVQKDNAFGIWSGKFRDWTVLHNYSHASNGRIWILSRGNRLEQFDDISREFVQFFSNSLGTADNNVTEVYDALLKDILGVGLTEDMCEGLIAPVLGREIMDVLHVTCLAIMAVGNRGGSVIVQGSA
ncbi:hypothetical protein V6N13_029456 [Hibiscus sabdariffa]